MEYCTDGTLHELIHQKRNGEMQMDEVYELYIQLCRGMRYCHEKGVVHRDLRVSLSSNSNTVTGWNKTTLFGNLVFF